MLALRKSGFMASASSIVSSRRSRIIIIRSSRSTSGIDSSIISNSVGSSRINSKSVYFNSS